MAFTNNISYEVNNRNGLLGEETYSSNVEYETLTPNISDSNVQPLDVLCSTNDLDLDLEHHRHTSHIPVIQHNRDYFTGKSFRHLGVWKSGKVYTNDAYFQDFVSKDNVWLACKKTHFASTTPVFHYDESGHVDGLDDATSEYWQIALVLNVEIDDTFDLNSEHPVQNKVVYQAILNLGSDIAATEAELTAALGDLQKEVEFKYNALSVRITTEVSQLNATIDAKYAELNQKITTAISNLDTVLSGKITAEVTRAKNAEAKLSNSINDLTGYVHEEVNRRIGIVESTLETKASRSELEQQIANTKQYADSKVSTETKRAQAAEKALDDKIKTISGLKIEVVSVLPAKGDSTIIYLLPKPDGETPDIYDEYIYVNNKWEKIGSTEIDLANYYNKEEIDSFLDEKAEVEQVEKLDTELDNVAYIDDSFVIGDTAYLTGVVIDTVFYPTHAEIVDYGEFQKVIIK